MDKKNLIMRILSDLRSAFPGTRIEDPKGMAELWIKKLSRYTGDVLEDACDEFIETTRPYTVFPTLPEMMQACDKYYLKRIHALMGEYYMLRNAPYDQFDEKGWSDLVGSFNFYGRTCMATETEAEMKRRKNIKTGKMIKIPTGAIENLAKSKAMEK
jgi:hypothetical protein